MRVVVYKENKNFQRERERERERVSYKFINSYESIQHVYPSNTNIYA